jgi:hypothetical protein
MQLSGQQHHDDTGISAGVDPGARTAALPSLIANHLMRRIKNSLQFKLKQYLKRLF